MVNDSDGDLSSSGVQKKRFRNDITSNDDRSLCHIYKNSGGPRIWPRLGPNPSSPNPKATTYNIFYRTIYTYTHVCHRKQIFSNKVYKSKEILELYN